VTIFRSKKERGGPRDRRRETRLQSRLAHCATLV